MAWMYALKEDGSINEWKGDSGPMSNAYWSATVEEAIANNWDHEIRDGKAICYDYFAKPRIGVNMRVGSPYGRSYSCQDYWTTTKVTEILEEYNDDQNRLNVKFRTLNSIYWWRE